MIAFTSKPSGFPGKWLGALEFPIDSYTFEEAEDPEMAALHTQMNVQFSEVQNNFEGPYTRDEKREPEYLLLRGQIARLEERVDVIEKKVA